MIAILFSSHSVDAQANTTLDTSGHIIVDSLSELERERLLREPNRIQLRLDNEKIAVGMLHSAWLDGDLLVIQPRFPLMGDKTYTLSLATGERLYEARLNTPTGTSKVPTVLWFSPTEETLPANLLRFYIHFSEPMARGQVRDAITLQRFGGGTITDPFLNLDVELWDREQKRLTIFMDPGRVKQGAGPNQTVGLPLVPGAEYSIVVDAQMHSASKVPLGVSHRMRFRAGPAERSQLSPSRWVVQSPRVGTTDALVVLVDHMVDAGSATNSIRIVDEEGGFVPGHLETKGAKFFIKPLTHWTTSRYEIRIEDDLEDVAGNTMFVPFDAKNGRRIGLKPDRIPVVLAFSARIDRKPISLAN